MPPLWEELAKGVRWAPAVHVVALHNLAVATLQGGRPRAALSIMECLLASGWVDKGALAGMRLDVLTAKGVAHAVVGEVDAVEALRERAQLLLGEDRRGATMLLDTMIGAPRGTLRADPTPDQLRLAESALPPISVRATSVLLPPRIRESPRRRLQPHLRRRGPATRRQRPRPRRPRLPRRRVARVRSIPDTCPDRVAPEETVLYQVVQTHWDEFRERAEEGGRLPSFVTKEVDDYLTCGILEHGLLRLSYLRCGHGRLVGFSCKVSPA